MQFLFLGIVFGVIILLLTLRRPLYQAILGGAVMTVLLFRIPLVTTGEKVLSVFTTWSSLQVLLSLYLITFLQRILEARSQIKLAQQDLNGIFHNRRVNIMGAPMFIGLLPSAAAMILCGDIVKDSSEGYLGPKDQAFVTSWVRHIPESSLPTYAAVLLMSSLSGIPLTTFMPRMIVPIIVLAAIPYFRCVRRLPKDPGTPKSEHRGKDVLHLFGHLWTLIAILALILAFGLGVVPSVLIVIAVALVVYRFSPKEIGPMIVSAFEKKLLLNSFLVLILKELISYTGVLQLMPAVFEKLPIPTYLAFVFLFFVGTLISGSQGMIAMGTPLAFTAMPDGGVALMVLLMCTAHAAMQLSPTHVCLVVAADYYKISMGELIRKTIPATLLFIALMIGYYNVLLLL